MQIDPLGAFLIACVIIGLVSYCVYLNNIITSYRTDFNDIFDRIRFWRKDGCDNDKGFWLLGDIAGIVARRQGYNHATVQREPASEDGSE